VMFLITVHHTLTTGKSCLCSIMRIFRLPYMVVGGMPYHSWLRHHGTSQKIAGLIPSEVVGFFNWRNPSSCTMALGLTQPLTEMSIRNLPVGYRVAGALGLQPYCHLWANCQKNVGASTSHNPMGLHGLLQGYLIHGSCACWLFHTHRTLLHQKSKFCWGGSHPQCRKVFLKQTVSWMPFCVCYLLHQLKPVIMQF
jgi:hypothetical protein